MPNQMPITPELVTWARKKSGLSIDEVSKTKNFRKIEYWEKGLDFPTYNQLEQLAEKFKIPVAVFFFPEPPELPPIEESFRTLGVEQYEGIPSKIKFLLRKARALQLGLEELYFGHNPNEKLITRDLSIQTSKNINKRAELIRQYLAIPIEEQFEWENADTALKKWRRAFYNVGVFVFKDSFRYDGYDGFCLYHKEFPIIYLNNSTTKTRQIFTLFHELSHLLYRTSGVNPQNIEYIDDLSQDNREIEIDCNQLAAQILVPESDFCQSIDGKDPTEETATKLAAQFSVSREVIYRRFLNQGLISREIYNAETKKWIPKKSKRDGGDYYKSKLSYLGKEYLTLAFKRYYQKKIDYNQLADYLVTKPKNVSGLEEELLSKSNT